MRKNLKKTIALLMVFTMTFTCMGCSKKDDTESKRQKLLNPEKPVTVTVWNYYNGDQLAAFENEVSAFNQTVGAQKGIIVESVSQGSIDNLANNLLDAVDGKAGAADVPAIASIYPETVYILEKEGKCEHLDSYFTAEELDQYIPSFIEDGRLYEGGPITSFPISKSTEVFVANETDWAAFEKETEISIDSIKTYEDLSKAAQAYYEWTDAQTPDVAEDGKALYGRDSVANYVYVGTKQLGHEMFKVSSNGVELDIDKDTFRTLWDNYYIPYINGYYGAYAKFRSEDAKTGKILSLTSSTSGISYIPTTVTMSDDSTHPIKIKVTDNLSFKNSVESLNVLQGAGYCVLKTTDAIQYASSIFLKWFTEPERNMEFSISSGYSPVTKKANDIKEMEQLIKKDGTNEKEQNVFEGLKKASEIFVNKTTYAGKPFDGSKDIRSYIEKSFSGVAQDDRDAVVEKISQGMSREEAVSWYMTDEYFDNWFNSFKKEIYKLAGK